MLLAGIVDSPDDDDDTLVTDVLVLEVTDTVLLMPPVVAVGVVIMGMAMGVAPVDDWPSGGTVTAGIFTSLGDTTLTDLGAYSTT